MKSLIFGVLCCATFLTTSAIYLSFGYANGEAENSTSVPLRSPLAESHQATAWSWPWQKAQATQMAAVGWKGCKWCEKLKTEVLPPLVKQGYDVRYIDLKKWKGPRVKTGPTLFYMDSDKKIVKIEKGYRTVEQIKEVLDK